MTGYTQKKRGRTPKHIINVSNIETTDNEIEPTINSNITEKQ
ncbi:MAG: hypothetical protein ACKPKO_07935 [Candidatus Fonsibacter sp.]